MILFQDGILATMILKLYPLIPTPGNNKVQAPLNANKNVTREQFLKFVMILQRKQKQRQQQQRQQQTEIEQKQTEKNDTFNDDAIEGIIYLVRTYYNIDLHRRRK